MILQVKKIIEQIPEPLSNWMAMVPYSLRLGQSYKRGVEHIKKFDHFDQKQKQSYIFHNVKRTVSSAYKNNGFYRDHYDAKGFHYDALKCFSDLKQIPLIKKSDLKKYKLEERSKKTGGELLINTGGTSGEPLEFYIDKNAFAREWAHMHHIWNHLDYKQTDLKLTFRGKNLGAKPIKYNPIHNEYIINAYVGLDSVVEALTKVLKKKIRFLHGYPSSIYRFAKYCQHHKPEMVLELNKRLKGIFLASEFPAPVYREMIEKVFAAPTISWYGHSEMAILAFEKKNPFVYQPMHTYGYCEAVKDDTNNSYRLVGTSYFNTSCPFIRYDTGDLVNPNFCDDGMLDNFEISSGRIGDFILDKNDQEISLTALIFGRHHPIFNSAHFLQVYQAKKGHAKIYVTLRNGENPKTIKWSEEFDSSAVNIDFEFIVVEKPYMTKTGKVPLLVREGHL